MSNLKYSIGTVWPSNKYGNFEIIDNNKDRTRFRVRFIETGYETDISYGCMIHGEVRDPYYPIYYGVGCFGLVSTSKCKKEISLWRGMIDRCYNSNNPNYIYYGAIGITVCDEWLCCERFIKDIPLIHGYDESLFRQGLIELDKDISHGHNNAQYNLANCKFVSRQINHNEMMQRRKQHTSSKYTGVTRLKDGKWQCSISHHSKNIYVGRYNTEEQARNAYFDKLKELGIEKVYYADDVSEVHQIT